MPASSFPISSPTNALPGHRIRPEELSFGDINFDDPIFDSVRQDYADHGEWRARSLSTADQRLALAARNAERYAGIAVLKHSRSVRGKALKISTLKVSDEHEGRGIADSLLAGVISLALRCEVEVVYTTVLPDHEDIARYLELRAFRRQPNLSRRGEFVYVLDLANPSTEYALINRLAYDLLAPEYLHRSECPGSTQESPEYLANLLLGRAKENPRVLEIGPGSGEVLAVLEKRSVSAVAVEISPSMAAIAAARAPRSPVVVGNVLDIEFPSGSFDAIYAGAILHLFPHADACRLLSRLHAWLCPGGVAFLNTSVSASRSEGVEIKHDYEPPIARYRAHWTEPEFRDLVTAAGFQVIDRATTDERERTKYWVAYTVEAIDAG